MRSDCLWLHLEAWSNNGVKRSSLGIAFLPFLLAACATTPSKVSLEDDYIANRRADGALDLVHIGRMRGDDGSIEIDVTAVTPARAASSAVTIRLGDMLQSAAAKECPTGFDMTQDKAPTVGLDENNELVATLRGTARCN